MSPLRVRPSLREFRGVRSAPVIDERGQQGSDSASRALIQLELLVCGWRSAGLAGIDTLRLR